MYTLKDGRTSVVKISTFYPDIPFLTLEDFNTVALFYVSELKKAFALANEYALHVRHACLQLPSLTALSIGSAK